MLLCLAGCNPKDVNSVTAQASGQESQEQDFGSLNLHYLDVGQGNAVLAESQGCYMPHRWRCQKGIFLCSELSGKAGSQELDYLLISHFDEDHLAGAIGALHKFPVKQLITPDYDTDSSIYQSYAEVVERETVSGRSSKGRRRIYFWNSNVSDYFAYGLWT